MAIAKLTKVEMVAPRPQVGSLLSALERRGLLHVEDVHEGLAEELMSWERREAPDSAAVDGGLAAARFVLEQFQRFAPLKSGLLEDFFASPPAVADEEFSDLVGSVDIHALRETLEQRLNDYESVTAELEMLRERINSVSPWQQLDIDLAAVNRGAYAALTPVRVAAGALPQLTELVAAIGTGTQLAPVSTAGKVAHAVVVSLPRDVEAVRASLKQVRAEEIELPNLHTSAAEAIRSAMSRIGELERRADELAAAFVADAEAKRRAVHAISDEYEMRKRTLDARNRVFYSEHAAVIVGWVDDSDRQAFEALMAAEHADVRFRLSAPAKDDAPPVKLRNNRLARPFQTLISMYGMPSYFGIDPTPFVAVAMTAFYAIALGDFGYGLLQILLVVWLRRRFKSAGETRLFLTMFLYMGVATLVVGVLTWSFFGFSPGTNGGESKFLGVLPLLNSTVDIIPLIALSVGIGIGFQLASIFAGFINLLKRGEVGSAIFDNLAWFVLLIGGLLLAGGALLGRSPLLIAGSAVAGAGGLVVILFAGRDSGNIAARLMTGIVSLYGIVGYYGLVGFFSDALSYMRLAILNMTSAFIAFVARVIGGLFLGDGDSIVLAILAAIMGGLVFLFFHLLNLVLSMLGAFVHSLRLNYLESFQRYYPEGGRPFAPLQREGRHFRFDQ